MKQMDIKTIRAAVTQNRGGLQDATDVQIRRLWDMLPADVQEQYLKTINNKENSNAKRDRSKSEIQSSS